MPALALHVSRFVEGLRRRVRRRRARTRRFAFCTIATRDFLPWALALFDALRRQHPVARLALLYVAREGEDGSLPAIEGVEVLAPSALFDAAAEAALRRRYGVAEFCFAAKPRLLRHCLDHFGDRAVYLDSDIDVVGPFDEAAIALEGGCALLTPHLDQPIPVDGRRPTDATILRAGAFNLGFAAVTESIEARKLLEWWDERVRRWGFVAPETGYQGDQKWMDLAPTLFPGVCVLCDPGSNVAYWNLHSRSLADAEGRLTANGVPVCFLHFSGFDPDRPDVLSRFQDRFALATGTALADAARDYARRLLEARERAKSLAWTPAPARPAAATPRASAIEGSMGDGAYVAAIALHYDGGTLETGEEAVIRASVTNASPVAWPVAKRPDGSGGIALTWHLRDERRQLLEWDNPRFPIPHDLGPGESAHLEVGVRVPWKVGRYFAEFDLVHEGVGWFGDRGTATVSQELRVGGLFDDLPETPPASAG